MPQQDKMHPDDLRNLVIFGLISIVLWFAYTHFVLDPQKERMRAAQKVQAAAILEEQKSAGLVEKAERPIEAIIAEDRAQNNRVEINSDLVFGSINLVGARLDHLGLKNHFETVEREKNSVILFPSGTTHPKYIEHGWVSPDQSLKLPDAKTKWSLANEETLTPSTPITLRWDNGQGLVFEKIIALNEDYFFTVTKKVINNTQSAVTLYPYSIIAQRSIPKEFMNRFIVHEGPIAFIGDELFEETYGKMSKNPVFKKSASQGWVGLTTKDWHTALIPEQSTDKKFRMVYTKGVVKQIKDLYQADVTGAAVVAQAGESKQSVMNVYAGAKKFDLLKKYQSQLNVPNFDLAVDFGIFFFLTKPFFYVINFFYGLVGNFGIAIILFTIVLRVCVYPLANTSFKSFANMRKIAPQMHDLREKYKDDKQQMQKELVKLYQKEKVNPMAGCLPILVQIPIFFSLFKVLSNTIEMRHAPFFGWIQDLSAPDPTSFWNLFGFAPWDWDGPGFLEIGAWPILMLITMLFQRTLSPPPTDKSQAFMFSILPWVMTIILSGFAAGLVIYWTFNNLFSTIQQYIIMRRMGVDVDIIGNIMGRITPAKEAVAEATEEITDTAKEKVEEVIEETPKEVSPPKPKKSKKKK